METNTPAHLDVAELNARRRILHLRELGSRILDSAIALNVSELVIYLARTRGIDATPSQCHYREAMIDLAAALEIFAAAAHRAGLGGDA